MTDRIRFITHQGKQILLLDLSNCSAAEVEKTCRAVPDLVTAHPRGSVLIRSDFTGASFDEEAIRVMKESAVFDKPSCQEIRMGGSRGQPCKQFTATPSTSARAECRSTPLPH